MHRIDGAGATVDNKFTDGDPVGGVQATVVTDDWLNDVQENILAVLSAAGVTPTKGRANDLLDSMKGRLIGVRTFSTPGTFTYTPTAGTKYVEVLVVGGGGGGGSNANTTTAGFAAGGGGGNAGAISRGLVLSGFAGLAVTVGAGGAGGPASTPGTAGSNGTTSSFGSLLTAAGGNGGVAGLAVNVFPAAGVVNTTPAVAIGGSLLNIPGSIGFPPAICRAANIQTGSGASSPYGAGGGSQAINTSGVAGINATGFGSGGGGAGSVAGGVSFVGGNGSGGYVEIKEYS